MPTWKECDKKRNIKKLFEGMTTKEKLKELGEKFKNHNMEL